MLERTLLQVRVKPRSKQDEVLRLEGTVLRVSVRAAPEQGKANAAVCKTIARWLGVPKSNVAIVSGEASRDKRVAVVAAPSVVQRALDLLA